MKEHRSSPETVWVPGHAGWHGPQRSMSGLVAAGCVLGVVIILFGVILFVDPAPAMKLLGASVVAALGVGVWLLVVHIRVTRVRVVRAAAEGQDAVFTGAAEVIWPLRLFALVGGMILAGWTWSVCSVPADRLTTLTLLVVPVIGLIMTIVGVRSWFRPLSAHRLTLSITGVELRIPHNNATLSWDELTGASLEGNRVVVRTATAPSSSWAAGDLASDPVILAELVTFYANSPEARTEIGAGTIARLRSGEF